MAGLNGKWKKIENRNLDAMISALYSSESEDSISVKRFFSNPDQVEELDLSETIGKNCTYSGGKKVKDVEQKFNNDTTIFGILGADTISHMNIDSPTKISGTHTKGNQVVKLAIYRDGDNLYEEFDYGGVKSMRVFVKA